MSSRRRNCLTTLAAALGVWALYGAWARAVETNEWIRTPYRVGVFLAVDDDSRPQPQLAETLRRHIADRVDAILRPLWALDIQISDDAATRRQCFALREIGWDDLPVELKSFDKLLWLGVRAHPSGYELSCRELDLFTRRWGPVHRREVRQSSFLPESAFQSLVEAFSPLAIVEPIENNDKQVRLILRGSELPARAAEEALLRPGEALLPLLRRTDRSGKVTPNGIVPVPYTFLALSKTKEDWRADVYTGARRPFAAERRVRIDQIAIALRNPPGPARVRFYARSDKNQGLAGYEVFQSASDGTNQPLGSTDAQGIVTVLPGTTGVAMLLLRSGGQLLAKAPAPLGAGDVLEVPVADNMSRLRAQSEAQSLREQLVDIVARRTIMMARVRALLKKNRVKEATELMDQLDSLPSSSAFGRSLDAAARKIPPSNDPAVQKSIDKLFSTTRELLGKFLNNRPIIDLQSEVNAAPRGS